MRSFNINNLVQLTEVVDVAGRVVRVTQDPPVQKRAAQFRDDVWQAARSGGDLMREVAWSWARHGRGGAAQAAHA